MKIIIHQSICGENNKAWDLLQTTFEDISIAKKIAFKTDLQDQAGGIKWQPSLRAFVEGEYFLLMRTFSDKSPEVRSGRAFSHVLIIKKSDLIYIQDISILFKYLPAEINKTLKLEPINLKIETQDLKYTDEIKGRFNKAIRAYVKLQQFSNTIIWVGEDHYEQALANFWKIISIKDKEHVNFGIYFNVDAIPDDKLNFICIPENIESKFINTSFCLIRKNDKIELTDFSEQYLAGDTSINSRVKSFQTAYEIKQLQQKDIEKIAIVINTFEELESIQDIKKLVTLSHIIAEYSPEEKKGIDSKEYLIKRVVSLIENSGLSDFQLLKNFKLSAFNGSESAFSISIDKWLNKNIFSSKKTKNIEYNSLFKNVFSAPQSNWWAKKIQGRINEFLLNLNEESIKLIFNWFRQDAANFYYIKDNISTSKLIEEYFINQTPSSITTEDFQILKHFAVRQQWYRYHAKLVTLEYSFEQAISEQLKIDISQSSLIGIRIISSTVSPSIFLNYAISSSDQRLLKISSELCHRQPSLLDKLDLGNHNCKQIWYGAIEMGNGVLNGFKKPKEKIYELFHSLIAGNKINDNVLELISLTEYGNLINFPNRKQLWPYLHNGIKKTFLEKTSASLLESLSLNSTTKIPNDLELENYIEKYAINDFLYYNRAKIKVVLPIFIEFRKIQDNTLRDYIYNYQGNISPIEAKQLGNLIYNRNFIKSAHAINSKANKSNNWRHALLECYHLFDFMTKASITLWGTISNVNIDPASWWDSTEDIITELYPNGNSIRTIWKKIGGKESDIIINGTAAEVWNDLIAKLKSGKYKGISMNNLLKEVKKTYGESEKFKLIYNLKNKFLKG